MSERCFGAWQPGEGNYNYYIKPKGTTATLATKGMDSTNVSNLTTSLEADVKRLAADLKNVHESCMSLEGFSRPNNLRLVSVPESA